MITLTGKFIGEDSSSFVEFQVEEGCELLDRDTLGELQEELSCYEAYWQGASDTFKGNAIMISMDDSSQEDIDLICEHIDEAGEALIRDRYLDANTIRF